MCIVYFISYNIHFISNLGQTSFQKTKITFLLCCLLYSEIKWNIWDLALIIGKYLYLLIFDYQVIFSGLLSHAHYRYLHTHTHPHLCRFGWKQTKLLCLGFIFFFYDSGHFSCFRGEYGHKLSNIFHVLSVYKSHYQRIGWGELIGLFLQVCFVILLFFQCCVFSHFFLCQFMVSCFLLIVKYIYYVCS